MDHDLLQSKMDELHEAWIGMRAAVKNMAPVGPGGVIECPTAEALQTALDAQKKHQVLLREVEALLYDLMPKNL